MSFTRAPIETLLAQIGAATRELNDLIHVEVAAGRDVQWINESLASTRQCEQGVLADHKEVGLDAFSIIHALCRLAMMNDTEGIRLHQVRRLQAHLASQGAHSQANSLEKLIEAQNSPRGRPIRLVPSSADAEGTT